MRDKIKKLIDNISHDLTFIPERAGILIVNTDEKSITPRITCLRKPKQNGNYKFPINEQFQLARLGALRIQGLKRKIKKQNEYCQICKKIRDNQNANTQINNGCG